jgi:uncharacterized protein YqgC (DUF456 family)
MLYGIGLVLGAILILLGFVGSVLPVLPGPPLSFVGLFAFALVRHFSPPLTPVLIIVMLIVTVLVVVLDYIIPVIGAKKHGASQWGIYGSMAGMIAGIFFPPFGVLVGAFVGAVLVEWIVTRKESHALSAGWGIFVGSVLGMALKLGTSGVMAYYFLAAALS